MSNNNDLRLIEDYLPIAAISNQASREKSIRKGHISTIHLWWARRPLVACRAAVYGSLVAADRWVKDVDIKNPPPDPAKASAIKNGKKRGLNRKAADEFVENLCVYPAVPRYVQQAQQHVLEAHAERLTRELAESRKTGKATSWIAEFKFKGDHVSAQDIADGRAPRARVLDMFGGGGAIPLEAQRLGCDTYSLDLNPVAHIIQLCTLVYPQKFGRPDAHAYGTTGPKDSKGNTTWGGLIEEVRHWGAWVLEQAKSCIGDLYPPIPDPALTGKAQARPSKQNTMWSSSEAGKSGLLTPLAYIWTRTVRCKKPGCGAMVPLVRQTGLCQKDGRHIAVKMTAPRGAKEVRFEVVEADDADGLGFDPSAFSSGGSATCPFCTTVADIDYVKVEGCATRIGAQLMAVVCGSGDTRGKRYVGPEDVPTMDAETRASEIAKRFGITIPDETLEANPRSFDVHNFGFGKWRDIFTPRQLAAMTAFAGAIRSFTTHASTLNYSQEHTKALAVCLSMVLGRLTDYCTAFCTWQPEFIKNTFNSPGLPMVMDFAEGNPTVDCSGSWISALDYVASALEGFAEVQLPGTVMRGSALAAPWPDDHYDAVVTDPPYYDSRSYSNLADCFYVWHKRSIGHLLPEHFATELTPKKSEAIAAPYRHGGSRAQADNAYESMMQKGFQEAQRLLKPGAPMVCVYAHKTTAGWSTLINSLMGAGFTVVEAWPVAMERKSRQNAQNTAALASSIFLVARKRPVHAGVGNYESDVQPSLVEIVAERVASLWEAGITGADLVIAAVGAGLRAFTRFEKVEYANGEVVPAEKFLAEVEGVVLDTMMAKLFGIAGGNVSAVDAASRFYVLWRFIYKAAEIDAGEIIVFANGTHIELDGPDGLTTGRDALVEKKKAKYLARDFSERGQFDKLGLPSESGQPAPLIDVLHRILWLMDNSPRKLPEFLDEARPDRERLRVLAQALAGAALSGKSGEETEKLVSTTPAEQAALGKLLANWRSLIESRLAAAEEGLFAKPGK
jgi:putative DNA methylase